MKRPSLGPAFLVTAAFVGPGTVITCTMAGANFGFALIWALVFSVIATIVLQQMTARLGIVTQQGLGENIRETFTSPWAKFLSATLVISAVVIGNGAYQGGNIAGASLGLSALFGDLGMQFSIWPIVIGATAFLLLFTGSYKFIEKALMVLVGLMSLSFVVTAVLVKPDIGALLAGMFIPSLPDGATLTIIALIGTTVVPYNLFLHASSVSKKWQKPEQIAEANQDLYISIPLGGVLSIAIVSTAATAFFGTQLQIQSAADIAPALQPLFGDAATWFISIGLFCAGISSSITAPLAAAFALSGVLNLSNEVNARSFKSIWFIILVIGVVPAVIGYKPISIIWFAQVANGLMLPLLALFLLWLMNNKKLGEHRNNSAQNVLGSAVVAVSILLSGRSLMSAFGLL